MLEIADKLRNLEISSVFPCCNAMQREGIKDCRNLMKVDKMGCFMRIIDKMMESNSVNHCFFCRSPNIIWGGFLLDLQTLMCLPLNKMSATFFFYLGEDWSGLQMN